MSWRTCGSRGQCGVREGREVKLGADGARAKSKKEMGRLLKIFIIRNCLCCFCLHPYCYCESEYSNSIVFVTDSNEKFLLHMFFFFLNFCPASCSRIKGFGWVVRFRPSQPMMSAWRRLLFLCVCAIWNQSSLIWLSINGTFTWSRTETLALLFSYLHKTKYEIMVFKTIYAQTYVNTAKPISLVDLSVEADMVKVQPNRRAWDWGYIYLL